MSMHIQPSRWVRPLFTILLTLTLTACYRSASEVMTTITPLPSAPPPTATAVLQTEAASVPVTATSRPTAKPTATKALLTEEVTATASTGVTCAGAPQTRLQVGLYAYVNPEPPLPNNLRSNAGESSELIGYIEPGQAMKILEGPECADGWLWWKVQTLEADLTGWTAEGDAQGYWLVPCSSQDECMSQP